MSVANTAYIGYKPNVGDIRFTHEGGSNLYHFCANECGLTEKHYNPTNVVFFANSEEHALEILKRFFTEYLKYYEENTYSLYTDHIRALIQHYLENFDKVRVTLAPKNGFMNVAWAGNDYFA